jgi:hypothetical protein
VSAGRLSTDELPVRPACGTTALKVFGARLGQVSRRGVRARRGDLIHRRRLALAIPVIATVVALHGAGIGSGAPPTAREAKETCLSQAESLAIDTWKVEAWGYQLAQLQKLQEDPQEGDLGASKFADKVARKDPSVDAQNRTFTGYKTFHLPLGVTIELQIETVTVAGGWPAVGISLGTRGRPGGPVITAYGDAPDPRIAAHNSFAVDENIKLLSEALKIAQARKGAEENFLLANKCECPVTPELLARPHPREETRLPLRTGGARRTGGITGARRPRNCARLPRERSRATLERSRSTSALCSRSTTPAAIMVPIRRPWP